MLIAPDAQGLSDRSIRLYILKTVEKWKADTDEELGVKWRLLEYRKLPEDPDPPEMALYRDFLEHPENVKPLFRF
jgi:hypothetical protein